MASKRLLAQRVYREGQRFVYHTVIDGALPIITNLGAHSYGVHHRDIPYHEHEGVSMYLDVYAPDKPGAYPVLVSYHGGAWMLGRRHNLQRAGQYFAKHGFVVFNCSYRLAPKHGFPASIQDAMCALRWVYDHAAEYGGDPTRIGVWGDSAGGHLSAMMAVSQHVPDVHPACACNIEQEVPISAAVHFYGVFDFVRFANQRFPLVKGIVKAVVGDATNVDELLASVSPERHARPGHVPPTLLLCGARDPLFNETRRYAQRLQQLGGNVNVKIYPHGVHGFLNLWWTHEGRDSVRLATEHFSKYLKPEVKQKAA